MKWIRITEAENIPPREGRPLQLGDRSVAIFNLGERFVAVENRCRDNDGIVNVQAGGNKRYQVFINRMNTAASGIDEIPVNVGERSLDASLRV